MASGGNQQNPDHSCEGVELNLNLLNEFPSSLRLKLYTPNSSAYILFQKPKY